MSAFRKVKKYLLLVSAFFSILAGSHLGYMYLYEGSSKYPGVGGSVSVGFVGDSASLNPLEFGMNPSNDYILQFLYKSLLQYDPKTKRMIGNLANCDLGKDFSKIKCYIKSDSHWNDGTPITKQDVLATYKAIKETDVNKQMKKMLESVKLTDKGDYIEFSSNNADVLLLDSFVIPIVKVSQIAAYAQSNGQVDKHTTSGPYIFGTTSLDSKLNIKKISIMRNKSGGFKDIYIDKYTFKFFPDNNTLVKNEDTLNIIFLDSYKKKLLLSPRFLDYKYILPQYVGLFLNTERIPNADLRKFILFQLENSAWGDLLSQEDGKMVSNPFFTDERITPEIAQKNISSVLNSLGYYKKEDLLTVVTKKYSDQLIPAKPAGGSIPQSAYFTTPTKDRISFLSNVSEILLSGNVPAGTEAVFVNDYKLTSFVPGNTKFYFRAKKEFGNLKIGANYYSLTTQIAGKKAKRETITIHVFDKPEEAEAKKKEVIAGLSATKEISLAEKEKMNKQKGEELARINALDPIYYYDKNLADFKLKFEYSDNGQIFTDIAEKVKSELKMLGIDLELKPSDQKRMEEIVKKGDKDYDILLTGVNHGLYYYNISSFFHSGQAKEGFNFSKIKNVHLDLLLEKLKSSELSKDLLDSIEKESLLVLRNEAVVKTLYSPYSTFYVDKNLKSISSVDMLPYSYFTYKITEGSYIKEDWIIDYQKKSVSGFLGWIQSFF